MKKNRVEGSHTYVSGKSYTVEDDVAAAWIEAGIAAASNLDDLVQGLQDGLGGGDESADAGDETEEMAKAVAKRVESILEKSAKSAGKAFSAARVDVKDETKSFGDFVKLATQNNEQVLKNKYGVARKATNNENTNTAGGFLVPQIYVNELLRIESYDALWKMAKTVPMQNHIIHYPVLDQTSTPSGGQSAFAGGVVCGFVAEGTAPGSTTQPAFKQLTLTARKLLGYTQVTNELMNDSPISMTTILNDLFSEAIDAVLDYNILNGAGPGGSPAAPTGIVGNAATVTVHRATAGQFKLADAANMYALLPQKSRKNAAWVVHPLVLSQLITMATTGSFNYLVWYPGPNVQGGFGELRLFGLPVYECQQSATLGTAGDVLLIDFSKYILGIRQDLEIFGSPIFAMTSDMYTVRFSLRVDGIPQITAPVTLADGVTQVSPFLELGNVAS